MYNEGLLNSHARRNWPDCNQPICTKETASRQTLTTQLPSLSAGSADHETFVSEYSDVLPQPRLRCPGVSRDSSATSPSFRKNDAPPVSVSIACRPALAFETGVDSKLIHPRLFGDRTRSGLSVLIMSSTSPGIFAGSSWASIATKICCRRLTAGPPLAKPSPSRNRNAMAGKNFEKGAAPGLHR